MKTRILYLILLVPVLLSCKKEEIYQVDKTLDPYLQMFLDEASKRGFHFNLEKDGLLLKFADLKAPTIGLCTYTDPLLVEIDRTYWKEVTRYENCEDLRQNVVFHELAHGLLNRRHDNAYLANTEWKSIMCGGDEVEGRNWSVNFTGYRKEYYINELFNSRQAQPEWASTGTFEDLALLGDTIASLNLNRTFHKEERGLTYDISKGVYTISVNQEINNICNLYIGNISSDFYYETHLKASLQGNGDCVGIGTGYKNDKDSLNFNFFYLQKNNTYNQYRTHVINQRCQPPMAEVLMDKDCNLTEYTKLAIERKKGELYFYVNDRLTYHHDFDAHCAVTRLCVIAPAYGSVAINKAICRTIGSSLLKSGHLTDTEITGTDITLPLPGKNFNK